MLLPPQGFGPEAKTRAGIIMVPAYKYLQIEISTNSMEFSLCIWKISICEKRARGIVSGKVSGNHCLCPRWSIG